MTIQELITDLKAAGANENTLRLAMNCYELGQANECEACAKVAEDTDRMVLALLNVTSQPKHIAEAIRARGQQ